MTDTVSRQKSAGYKASRVYSYRGGMRKIVTEEGPLDLIPHTYLSRKFTPVIDSEDVIAGRRAWVLRLKPNVKHGPWMQMWIDKKSHVVLATRFWTGRNTVEASMKTLRIAFENS